MALTLRLNGNAVANQITSTWVNDYYNLLTGGMSDQPVTIQQHLSLQRLANTNAGQALTITQAAGSNLIVGSTYKWAISYSAACIYGPPTYGESLVGATSQITVVTANCSGNITNIPLGPSGTIARNVYRTKAGGTTLFYVGSIPDNVTTTYSDVTADGALSTQTSAVHSLFMGTLWCADETGATACGYGKDTILVNQGLMIRNGSGPVNMPALAEFKTSGDLLISGTHYSSTGTAALQNSQTFDSFDYAECYQCDQDYPSGTVLCPCSDGILSRCDHDGCHACLVVSLHPGNCIGQPDASQHIWPMALAGRVMVACDSQVEGGEQVCSDGFGGCRPVETFEEGYAIGFAIQASADGQVGVVLRHGRL